MRLLALFEAIKHDKHVLWDNGTYFIAGNDPTDPTFLTLWTEDNQRVGRLGTRLMRRNNEDWLGVAEVSVKKPYQGERLAIQMYRTLIENMPAKYAGLIGYQPDIVNKRVHKIYKRLGATVEDGDYYIVPNPNRQQMTEAYNPITLYRGVNAYQDGGNYYTPDKEWARQFTQSGQDKEIKTLQVNADRIYRADPLPLATVEEFDDVMREALSQGKSAIWVDEGPGEPDSVFLIPMAFRRAFKAEQMDEEIGDDMRHEFTCGSCAFLALALNKKYGWPLVGYLDRDFEAEENQQIMGNDEPVYDDIHHIWVEIPNTEYAIDINGLAEESELRQHWALASGEDEGRGNYVYNVDPNWVAQFIDRWNPTKQVRDHIWQMAETAVKELEIELKQEGLIESVEGNRWITVYHGGDIIPGDFNLQYSGQGEGRSAGGNTVQPALGPGVYFSDDPKIAKLYMKYARQQPSLYKAEVDVSRVYDSAKGVPESMRGIGERMIQDLGYKDFDDLPTKYRGKWPVGPIIALIGKEKAFALFQKHGLDGLYEQLPNGALEISMFNMDAIRNKEQIE